MNLIDLSAPAAGTPIDTLVDATTATADGDWVDAGLHSLVLGLDVASVVFDPIGAVGRWAAEWLLEHCGPLTSILDMLAGNEAEVWACAGALANSAAILRDRHPGIDCRSDAGWSGEAARAQERARRQLAAVDRDLAAALDWGQQQLGRAAALVAGVREFVRSMLAEVIAQAVTFVSGSLATGGVGTAAAAVKVAVKVADAARTASRHVTQLIHSFARLEALLGNATHAAVVQAQVLVRSLPTRLPPLPPLPQVRTEALRAAVRQHHDLAPTSAPRAVNPLVAGLTASPGVAEDQP